MGRNGKSGGERESDLLVGDLRCLQVNNGEDKGSRRHDAGYWGKGEPGDEEKGEGRMDSVVSCAAYFMALCQ